MADIFISYSKGSQAQTQQLAEELRAKGFTVWYDTSLVPGDSFRDVIVSELTQARAAIVIWTADSVKSDWVCSEASRARARRILIPVRADDVRSHDIPPPFDGLHTELLSNRAAIEAALVKLGVNPNREAESSDRANAAGAVQDARPQLSALSEGLSIAVRPFTVLSEDRRLEFLANGLAEDVIALLARVPGFFLISRASSFAFENPETPASVIARQLGVRYVLEGSVRGDSDQVRVSTQLAEAATGRILWSGKFDARRADTLELQDDIARGIIIELEPALTQAEIAVIRRQRPENVDAWGCYHQAIGALGRGGWNEQAVSEAQKFLRRALDLDDSFELARAQLALLSALAQNTGLLERSIEDTQEALAAGEMAIARDPCSSEVLGYAGCALADLGQPERGAEVLRQAVELDPSNAQAEVALGAALAVLGNLDAGIARMRHGIKLSPRDRRLGFWGWALGAFLLRANRVEEALEEARIAARRDPRLYLPPILEAVAQVALGRADLGRSALISARRIRPELTQREIEISHGRRAAGILSAIWNVN